MKNKITFLCASSLLVVGAAAAVLATEPKTSFSKAKATTYELSLTSSTIVDGLSSTASSGVFTTKTSRGVDVGWSYNCAKTNPSGFITLSRTGLGNSDGKEGYIANTSPITSLESIDVKFVGSFLTFYGSVDGVDYERIRTISESSTITDLSHYFYFKAASGEQECDDLSITSLTITYSCAEEHFTPEYSDLINNNPTISEDIKDSGIYAVTLDSTDVYDASKSTESFLWTNNLSSKYKYVWLKLYRSYSVEELSNYDLVYYVKVSSDIVLSEKSNNITTDAYTDWKTKANGSTRYQNFEISEAHQNKWKKVVFDLSTLNPTSAFTMIRISVNSIITAGKLHLDGFHLVEKDTVPVFDYDYTKSANEVNDVTNQGMSCSSSSVTIDYSYKNRSVNSDRSVSMVTSSGYKFVHIDAVNDQDLGSSVVTFDYKMESFGAIFFAFYSNDNGTDTYYYLDLSETRTGSTVTNITGADGDTWKHVVFDCETAAAPGARKKTGSDFSDYQGIRLVDANNKVWVDNLTIA